MNIIKTSKSIISYQIINFCFLVQLLTDPATSCIIPERNTIFADFATRSEIVLRAIAVAKGPRVSGGMRYEARFRVFGLFPNKSKGFSVGDEITLGQFGFSKACQPISVNSQYILFLNNATAGNPQQNYTLRYNPVPYSDTNANFFDKVIAGKIKGRYVLRSGCRKPYSPKRAKVWCNYSRERCRIVCQNGFQARGVWRKTCNVKTMKWFPKGLPSCVPAPPTNSSANSEKQLNKQLNTKTNKDFNKTLNKHKIATTKTFIPIVKTTSSNIYATKKQIQSSTASLTMQASSSTFKTVKPPPLNTLAINLNVQNDEDVAREKSKLIHSDASVNKSLFNNKTQHPPLKENLTPKFDPPPSPPLTSNGDRIEHHLRDDTNQPPVAPVARINPPPLGDKWFNEDGDLIQPVVGFGGALLGCPTFKGNVTIHSIWRGGFGGLAYFPLINKPLIGGWVVRISFSIPVDSLETYTVEEFAVSQSKKEYCLIPKPYTVNLYQDLTLSFIGGVSSFNSSVGEVIGFAKLLGVCHSKDVNSKSVGRLTPFDDPTSSLNNAWITNRTVLPFIQSNSIYDVNNYVNSAQPVTFQTQAELTSQPRVTTISPKVISTTSRSIRKCSPILPNSYIPSGGKTKPVWRLEKNTGTQIDYNEILHKSILFYEAQRSGKLPNDNRIPWRGDADLRDGCLTSDNLVGGWYSSGGNIKSTFYIAFSITLLSWGAIEYKAGYERAGEWQNMLEELRWGTDYLIKCHTSSNELVVQIGDFIEPRNDWNPPENSNPDLRTVYKSNQQNPAADVAAEVAAALASVSIVFNSIDSVYAQTCLLHAIQLFNFAESFPQKFESFSLEASWMRNKEGSIDDRAWAALWLYQATGNITFFIRAQELYLLLNSNENMFYWGDKSRGIEILLSKFSKQPNVYQTRVENYLSWLKNSAHYTPFGLLWLQRSGTTMLASNAAFLALQASQLTSNKTKSSSYKSFAKEQMASLVGVDGIGFAIGIGTNSPKKPYHRGSSCPSLPEVCLLYRVFSRKTPHPHRLFGALVNGPGRRGKYSDRTNNVRQNKVHITFNAGFQSLAAGLKNMTLNS